MKALFLQEPGVTRIHEIDFPCPGAGEVLLRVELIGFCGSDLNSFRGRNPLVSFPRIPGHEVAATIASVGAGVPQHFREGVAVTVVPYTACDQCASCRRGRPNACQNNQTLGVQRDGAMREYLTMPWEKVIPSTGLSLRELCLVEPLSVGFHAIDRGRVTSEDIVAIFGCGGVGLGAIAASAFRNARTIAIDLDDAKLQLATRAGATDTIHSVRDNVHERLLEITGAQGPDVVVEAIGLPMTYRMAVEEVAFTGRVVYIGYAKEPVSYETRLFVQKELDITGSRNATPRDFEQVIAMLEQGRFPVDQTVSVTTSMEEAGDVLRNWDANPASFSKVLVQVA